jgi:pyruvate/2-oxoglutarate dehydrogenase complex dihydrolipoamide dehydrogenase (E3) component
MALAHAELIMGLCERFGCLPSQLLAEDARMLRWLRIESMGRKGEIDDGQ